MHNIDIIKVQLVRESSMQYNFPAINNPERVYRIVTDFIGDPDREHMVMICLNVKNKINALHTLSIGVLDATILNPREVFKVALLANSRSIILAHNHPSGDPTPSTQDIETTQRVYEAGRLMGIELVDHVVIGHDCWKSMRELGYI